MLAPPRRGRGLTLVTFCLLIVAGVAAVAALPRHRAAHSSPPRDTSWDSLDPTARCDGALALVTYPLRWPMVCRWRTPGDAEAGTAFPPPVGDPPWDNPHIEVYVSPDDSRAQVAHAIAHELGHMHHTREPTIASAWLAARRLPADTPWTVWVEDYAECFATVFGPPAPGWYAATQRPSGSELAALKQQFFAD